MSVLQNVQDAASWAGEQCVAFVQNVTGVNVSGNAKDYLTQYASHVHSTPKLGDIAVWGAGVNGADPKYGHVGIVSGLDQSGGTFITSTNAPEGSAASTWKLGTLLGAPSGYITPQDVGGANVGSGTPAFASSDAVQSSTGGFMLHWKVWVAVAVGVALIILGVVVLLRRDIPVP